jgi:F-type H+-transporting ATPase subunit a
MRVTQNFIWLFVVLCGMSFQALAQDPHNSGHTAPTAGSHDVAHADGKPAHEERTYKDMVMEHISNSNEFHIVGDIHLALPMMLYSFDSGLTTGMSSDFDHGHKAVNGYVLEHGSVRRLADPAARASVAHVEGFSKIKDDKGERSVVLSGGQQYELERPSTLLSFTSFIDFSITKNVLTILFAALILFMIFFSVMRYYNGDTSKAPKGIAGFIEPVMVFLRDDVVKPAIGPRWQTYYPYICSLFFFILVLNLLGLVPFFPGSANVTGSVATTAALAIITFLVVNFSGNKHYWGHIFWMPGVPLALKPVMAIIEFAGVFIKPFTLFIRLFANITAGHLIILSLIGLIWTLGKNGESMPGTIGGAVIGLGFTFAMNFLELFVACLQAFIFALLSSLYIGSAIEDHHGHEEAAHH